MSNEQITISRDVLGNVRVLNAKEKSSRLEWQAAGLDIYLSGKWSGVYEKAANVAVNECLARHIPTLSLRRVAR